MLTQLDPHSVFIPARELMGVNEDLAGRFEGIGVEFNIFEDTVHVLTVLKAVPVTKPDCMLATGSSGWSSKQWPGMESHPTKSGAFCGAREEARSISL